MAREDLQRLDSIDLSNITVADVRQMKNETLKRTLMDALQPEQPDGSHQNHVSHSDHVTSPPQKDPATALA